MKIGISFSIDVTKIDKARIHVGKKGKYADFTTFIDTDNQDEYGKNGFIKQSTTKEEREGGLDLPILGNVKVFYIGQTDTTSGASGGNSYERFPETPDDDSIPF